MKKQRIIDCAVIMLFCMLFCIAFLPVMRKISYFFRYQNTGRILLEIDGDEVILNNNDITLDLEDGSVETRKITNGKFKFWEEGDCVSTFNFKIPAELYEGQTDIFFEVEYFSGEHWIKNNFNINISITTDDEIKVYANGYVKTEGDKDPHYFSRIPNEITERDNIIKLYASGI